MHSLSRNRTGKTMHSLSWNRTRGNNALAFLEPRTGKTIHSLSWNRAREKQCTRFLGTAREKQCTRFLGTARENNALVFLEPRTGKQCTRFLGTAHGKNNALAFLEPYTGKIAEGGGTGFVFSHTLLKGTRSEGCQVLVSTSIEKGQYITQNVVFNTWALDSCTSSS